MPEMKDSGIEWIGETSKSHVLVRLKYIVDILDEYRKPVEANKRCQEADTLYPYYGASGVIDTIDGYTVDGHVMLIGEDGANLRMRNLPLMYEVNGKAWVNNHAHILKPKNGVDFWYLFYALESLDINAYITGSAQPKLNQENLKNILIPLPCFEVQKRISNIIVPICSEIDSLSADIQKEIETLEEYKKSVITEAVTKGLDPNVDMKDSGIEWIGEIPKAWEIIRGKFVLRYLQKPVKEDDGVITCFRDGEVTLRSNRREEGFTMSDKEIGYQGIDVGDLVVHGMDGFAGSIGISDSRGKASPVLNVLDTDMNKRIVMYYLRSMAYNNVFTAIATGIRVRSCDLRWNKLAELPYPVPSKNEQNMIVDFLDTKCAEIDNIISDKRKQLETLDEYKKSVIFEYVTGRKEVVHE